MGLSICCQQILAGTGMFLTLPMIHLENHQSWSKAELDGKGFSRKINQTLVTPKVVEKGYLEIIANIPRIKCTTPEVTPLQDLQVRKFEAENSRIAWNLQGSGAPQLTSAKTELWRYAQSAYFAAGVITIRPQPFFLVAASLQLQQQHAKTTKNDLR